MQKKYDNLFSPVRINTLELKNRAVMTAMGTGYADKDNTVSDRLISYLAARGDAGLIITEICAVDPRGRGFPNEVGLWDDRFIPGLSRLAQALHERGAAAAVQLHHAGRETFSAVLGCPPEAPSAVPSVILQQPCEEMSPERIREVVAAYGSAAERAKRAGFDAVEIHGAHGYLITQFLSPFSNHREDDYGGSDENRARFALDVVRSVREATGPGFPVIIRVSADEMIRGGYNIDFMKRLAPQLEKAGADAIHVSVGVYSTPGNLSIANMDTEPGFNLFRAREIKETVSIPVIAVGRISDPGMADEAIERGDADLVGFGRQFLADPDFLEKARTGRDDDIRRCISCNQGCIERLSYEFKSTSCSINPECGREYRGGITRAEKPLRVMVIGAGPAGLSAALAAVDRGHSVEVFERENEPGGQLVSASRPPNKEAFAGWVRWAVEQLRKKGARLNTGVIVTEDFIKKYDPDAVICAAGAQPSVPGIKGINGSNVHDARDVLTGRAPLAGPAVVLGAGYVGMETADFISSRGIKVTVIDMAAAPPVGKHTAHGYFLHKRLRNGGGGLILGAVVTEISEKAVSYTSEKGDADIEAAMVVTALGAEPENSLAVALESLGIPFHTAGDVIKPRRLFEAIHEGYRAGREIGSTAG